MLSYDSFKMKFLEDFMSYMGPYFDGYELQSRKVKKVNRILDGIGLINPTLDSQVSPTIYIEDVYDDYKITENYKLTLERAAEIMKCAFEKGKSMSPNIDYKKAENRIVFQLISTENNTSLLSEIPHREFLDLSVIYRWAVNVDSKGLSSVVIHNELAEAMGYEEEELFRLASENTPRILPYSFTTLEEVVSDIARKRGVSDEEIEHVKTEIRSKKGTDFYVLSNECKFMGASTILYKGLMSDIARRIGSDFYILPSSVNELIIVADSPDLDPQILLRMVMDVNESDVDPSDKLSDNVYRFSSSNQTLVPLALDRAN